MTVHSALCSGRAIIRPARHPMRQANESLTPKCNCEINIGNQNEHKRKDKNLVAVLDAVVIDDASFCDLLIEKQLVMTLPPPSQ